MVDIKNTELVFCDYSKAIEFAWGKGLSKKATILTQSPFLCLNNLYNTKSFNSYFKGSLPYFGKYVKEVCLDIEEKILKDKKNCFFLAVVNNCLKSLICCDFYIKNKPSFENFSGIFDNSSIYFF